jgi:hypothetical protein
VNFIINFRGRKFPRIIRNQMKEGILVRLEEDRHKSKVGSICDKGARNEGVKVMKHRGSGK